MEVILLDDVEHLGEAGEIHEVADGYGRNYLIPQGLARVATDGAVRQVEEDRRQQARKEAVKKEQVEELKKEIEDMQVVFSAETGEDNRIFGTVTTQQIAVEVSNRGLDIDRKNIELDDDIREVGVYTATIDLPEDVDASLDIQVIPESG